MNLTPTLASLRQLLAEKPSWSVWNRLVEHLDQWPEPSEASMIQDMVEAHLEGWPEGWRQGNHQWAEDSVGWTLLKRHTHTLSSIPDATEIWCPPASFTIGEDTSAIPARLERGFWVLNSPVTQAHWEAMFGNNPSEHKGDLKRPLENVNWYDACAFCNALSRAEGRKEVYEIANEQSSPGHGRERTGYFQADITWISPDANGYRLPTEFEWEWAARAGSTGTTYGKLDEIAWYGRGLETTTQPVGSKPPNAFGLYDTAGNVFEWNWSEVLLESSADLDKPNSRYKWDWSSLSSEHFLEDTKVFVPPHQPVPESFLYRGGNFASPGEQCHVNYRSTSQPQFRYTGVGFRIFRNG